MRVLRALPGQSMAPDSTRDPVSRNKLEVKIRKTLDVDFGLYVNTHKCIHLSIPHKTKSID